MFLLRSERVEHDSLPPPIGGLQEDEGVGDVDPALLRLEPTHSRATSRTAGSISTTSTRACECRSALRIGALPAPRPTCRIDFGPGDKDPPGRSSADYLQAQSGIELAVVEAHASLARVAEPEIARGISPVDDDLTERRLHLRQTPPRRLVTVRAIRDRGVRVRRLGAAHDHGSLGANATSPTTSRETTERACRFHECCSHRDASAFRLGDGDDARLVVV